YSSIFGIGPFTVYEFVPEKQWLMEELLEALKYDEFSTYRFRLSGHTCNIGTDEYNQALSYKRAQAAKEWLEAHGYPSLYLETVGFGEKFPIADNRCEGGRRLNRRVEIRTVGLVTKRVLRSLSGNKGELLLSKGFECLSQGDYEGAASLYEEALDLFNQEGLTNGVMTALGNLYLINLEMGNGEKAMEYLKAFNASSK
ncbi:MAG: OmpA family protein, partial [Candidatus Hodarchaeota archaeon]